MNMTLIFALGILLIAPMAMAQVAATRAEAKPTRPGWKLTWQDEFDGPAIDEKKWEVLRRKNSHNNELQNYVPEQAKIDNGRLVITATDEPLEGKKYRSARLETWFTQSHGRFEARIKLPRTQGMWPAFWLLPRPADWPKRGEIDIMESKGSNTKWTSSAYHFLDPKSKKHNHVAKSYVPKNDAGEPVDLADDFHVYAVEWQKGELKFFLDDEAEPYYTVTQEKAPISDEPMCVILNLAVGGWFGGNPDQTTTFPQMLEVDWVRVWKRE